MKKLLLIALLVFPSAVFAQENYSGVYQKESDFFSIHHIGNQLVFALLDTQSGTWEAYEGEINSNTGTIYSVYAPGTAIFKIEFSPESAELKLLSCTAQPGSQCNIDIGTTVTIQKIM